MNLETRRQLTRFWIKSFLVCIPLFLAAGSFVVLDPFQVVWPKDDFYVHCRVEPNRDWVSMQQYLRHSARQGYDSFIFGSSRSGAFSTAEWRGYLKDGVPFHFGVSSESLYGIWKKIKYIDASGGKLKHALVVVDRDTLVRTTDGKGHLFIKHPVLSGRSWFSFYGVCLQGYFSDRFFLRYLDFKWSGVFKPWMKGYILDGEIYFDPVTNDERHGLEAVIDKDPDAFYNVIRKDVFYSRGKVDPYSAKPVLTPAGERMLDEIAAVFAKHGTDYEIVISPLYDQLYFNGGDRKALKARFGAHVHDFSGVNAITSDIRNYGETSHYRVHVGRDILSQVYGPRSL